MAAYSRGPVEKSNEINKGLIPTCIYVHRMKWTDVISSNVDTDVFPCTLMEN